MKFKFTFTAIALCFLQNLFAQDTYPYNGVRPKDVTCEVFTHATIFVDYQTKLIDATLVVRNGKVEACGNSVAIPADAIVYDLKGKYVYPAFIDLFSDYGMPKVEPRERERRAEKFESDRKGAFGWNAAIRADIKAAGMFVSNDETAKELRAQGFGVVLTHQQDGIARGTSSLVTLGSNNNFCMLMPEVAAQYSFNKGTSSQDYPSSLMGSIALLRQTYYDAMWYQTSGVKEERNLSLEAFNSIQSLPQIFDAGDKWNVLRADNVGDEFNTQYIIKSSGNEYHRLEEMKESKAAFIVPVAFPSAYDVSDPYSTRMVSIEEMKHWELAPSNAMMLWKEGITFCFTANGLQDKKEFLSNIRKSIQRGLPEQEALKALTQSPASLIKAEKEVGALRQGMWANFFVSSRNVFEDGAVIYENWIQGERFFLEASDAIPLAGNYKLQLPKAGYNLEVKGEAGKPKGSIQKFTAEKKSDGTVSQDTTSIDVNIVQQSKLLTISFEPKDDVYTGVLRMCGEVMDNGNWRGTGQDGTGAWFDWTAGLREKAKIPVDTIKKDSAKTEQPFGNVIFPFNAYGWEKKPEQETVLIVNATIWTCEEQGKIENGQLLISRGKIIAVGKDVDASKYPGAKLIDGTGMHVSPGIIDEHSHIALESVNEGGQTSSAEVREENVVWPEDVNIYRQLSGGVVAAQLLHGSANAIGGQSAVVKMRWGSNAEDMLIENAAPFIKFALGENVKHSAWGNDGTQRFPQTRMGVEQVYYDHFIRAREYGAEWNKYKSSILKTSKGKGVKGALPNAPRRDLELEALNEILEKRRFITCHSYVQSEINMLMHVADSMDFTVNTFTHILEGYKVADKMKEHGVGASSFSDWWAYKWEVKDAIPHNGALLWENGITVAFNSDDAEMARRLNQEAGKAVKYGNVPEEEALKFVTLNPAKLLHLDDHMGSIKPGKDADIVIWNNNPLSIYAVAQQTYVDGICYFDINKSKVMDAWMEKERARLIQKMLGAKNSGDPTQKPSHKHHKHFHCETLDETAIGVMNR